MSKNRLVCIRVHFCNTLLKTDKYSAYVNYQTTFLPFFLFSFFSHFSISRFKIKLFYGTSSARLWNAYFISYVAVKEFQQRKNINVLPKSFHHDFRIRMCSKGKDFGFLSSSFPLRTKLVSIVSHPAKANHEGPTFFP